MRNVFEYDLKDGGVVVVGTRQKENDFSEY